MRELVEGGEGDNDEKRSSQKLLLFTRVFALCPKLDMFAQVTGELNSQLESKGNKN